MIVVRRAALSDLPTLRLMWEAMYHESPIVYPTLGPDDLLRWTRDMAIRLEQQANGDPLIFIALAVDDSTDEPFGFVSGWVEERRIGTPHHYWMADHLYVAPEARNQGIAMSLIAAGAAHGVSMGVTVLECIAVAGDEQWARRGWQPTLARYRNDIGSMMEWYSKRGPTLEPDLETAPVTDAIAEETI